MQNFLTEHDARQYSPLALAFLGDSVYEQKVRTRLVLNANMPSGKLHDMSVKLVCAEYQNECVKKILDEDLFSENEFYIFKRGRNANGVNPPKHASIMEYRNATGLETVFGYLALIGDFDRIDEIFEFCFNLK